MPCSFYWQTFKKVTQVYGTVQHMLMCRVQGWANRTLQFPLSSLLSKGSERQAGHKAETDNTRSFLTSAFHFNLKARKKPPHLMKRDQVSLLSTILQLSSFSLYSINPLSRSNLFITNCFFSSPSPTCYTLTSDTFTYSFRLTPPQLLVHPDYFILVILEQVPA